ncbi:hypothetical protein [Yoonia sp.]|jgi:hypothetical protein|uniref:hypothetical protein n=1 Tax=Yoonia sp. TaxID=2212373 RepID=UPI004048925D
MCSERQQGPASETLTGEDRRDKHESADSVMRQRSMLPTLKDSYGPILLKNSS